MEKAQADLRLLTDPLQGKEGTIFDQPAPTGPPTPPKRMIPKHLGKVINFFSGIIADESLLLDLCLDRAMEIVQFNCAKRRMGSDYFNADATVTPEGLSQLASPIAIELYRQTIESIKDRAKEYTQLLEEAKEEMERGQEPASRIFTP